MRKERGNEKTNGYYVGQKTFSRVGSHMHHITHHAPEYFEIPGNNCSGRARCARFVPFLPTVLQVHTKHIPRDTVPTGRIQPMGPALKLDFEDKRICHPTEVHLEVHAKLTGKQLVGADGLTPRR
jgi:hypothetical protein